MVEDRDLWLAILVGLAVWAAVAAPVALSVVTLGLTPAGYLYKS
jgi:hypothetical protein